MKSKSWLGLLAAGPMSPALFRVPNLNSHLGPVVSGSLRVASRLANRLKAGKAASPDGLKDAELIFITGPESGFPELLALALAAGIDWRGRSIVLLDFRRDVSDLEPLRARGASTGTLDYLDAFSDSRFVADADDICRRRIQRFAAATSSSVFYLESGRKQVFAAGAAFTGSLFAPQVAASVDCLKKAGLTSAEASLIAERNSLQTLRSWLKSGRKGWTGTIPDRDIATVHRQLGALRIENAMLSEYFSQSAKLALALFGEDSGWLNPIVDSRSSIMDSMDDSQSKRLELAGRLAANLAHDWNNVLTLLAAQASEIAQTLPVNHPAHGMLEELNSSIDLASNAPRRLLGWLRDEPGRLAPMELNAAIRAALPLIQVALGAGIQCETNFSEANPVVQLDGPQFVTALLNMASNSASAMNGKGTFSIATTATPDGITLSVSDTGVGMDEATRQRAFEPFFSTRLDAGGTGLGLQTVKTLAESHDASISINSAPDQGCTVEIRFPANLATKAAAATPR